MLRVPAKLGEEGMRHSRAVCRLRLLQTRRRVRLLTTKPPSGTIMNDSSRISINEMTRPTWSVHHLLEKYPAPTISPSTLIRLHKSSALVPPPADSGEMRVLRSEMEGLIKLVEAVKLVDAEGLSADGRVWVAGRGIDLASASDTRDSLEAKSTDTSDTRADIVRHASRTVESYYVVEGNRSLPSPS